MSLTKQLHQHDDPALQRQTPVPATTQATTQEHDVSADALAPATHEDMLARSAEQVLRLQRTLGNRATGRLLSPSVQRDWAGAQPTSEQSKTSIGSRRPPWTSGSRDQTKEPNRTSNVIGDQRRSTSNTALDGPGIGPLTYEQFRQAEYIKFETTFLAFKNKYQLDIDQQEPRRIWNELLNNLSAGNPEVQKLPKTSEKYGKALPGGKAGQERGDADRTLMAVEDPDGKMIRMKALDEAMKVMDVFVAHAGTYLTRAIDVVLQKGGKPTWCFWSGLGAKDLALQNNPDGIVLEGTVGSWFDKVWSFDKIIGGPSFSLHLWTSVSQMYAIKAAEYYQHFRFKGYVGPTASFQQNVFNQIESPSFIEVLGQKYNRQPQGIEWYIVDCEKDKDGKWAWTNKKRFFGPEKGIRQKMKDRDDAIKRIRELYEQ